MTWIHWGGASPCWIQAWESLAVWPLRLFHIVVGLFWPISLSSCLFVAGMWISPILLYDELKSGIPLIELFGMGKWFVKLKQTQNCWCSEDLDLVLDVLLCPSEWWVPSYQGSNPSSYWLGIDRAWVLGLFGWWFCPSSSFWAPCHGTLTTLLPDRYSWPRDSTEEPQGSSSQVETENGCVLRVSWRAVV